MNHRPESPDDSSPSPDPDSPGERSENNRTGVVLEIARRSAVFLATAAFFLLIWNPARNHFFQGPVFHASERLSGVAYQIDRYEANGLIVTPLTEDVRRESGRGAFTKRQSNTYYFLVLLLATIAFGATLKEMAAYWAVYAAMEVLSVFLLLAGLGLTWNFPLFLMEFNSYYLARFIVVLWGFVSIYSAVTGHAALPVRNPGR